MLWPTWRLRLTKNYVPKSLTYSMRWTYLNNLCRRLNYFTHTVAYTGQDRFASLTRVYYKESHACVIMFDLLDRSSFKHVVNWKLDLDTKCTLHDGSPIPCILLANKVSYWLLSTTLVWSHQSQQRTWPFYTIIQLLKCVSLIAAFSWFRRTWWTLKYSTKRLNPSVVSTALLDGLKYPSKKTIWLKNRWGLNGVWFEL